MLGAQGLMLHSYPTVEWLHSSVQNIVFPHREREEGLFQGDGRALRQRYPPTFFFYQKLFFGFWMTGLLNLRSRLSMCSHF